MMEPEKSGLEKQIDEISKKVGIPLKKHETTPGVGNCWYEACASLLKLNNMKDISAKQLRKEVVDNIEKCNNFKNVFEIVFESDHTKLAEFKTKHCREGEFTDEDGVMVLATGLYLGVTLRIFSKSNTKLHPYTEYNENQTTIFNIFLDDRSKHSEHFQSLKQPEKKAEKTNPENRPEIKGNKPATDSSSIQENKATNSTKIGDPIPVIEIPKKANSAKSTLETNTTKEIKQKTKQKNIPKEVKSHEDPIPVIETPKMIRRVKSTPENNTTKIEKQKIKQENIPNIVEIKNNQEPSTNTTKKSKYDESKDNVKDPLENSPEETVKEQDTPKITECHKKPEPIINTTEKCVEIKSNSDHKKNDPKETCDNTKQETKDYNKNKQEDNRDTNKNNKIKKSEENHNEIKNTHPEEYTKKQTKTKIIKNNQIKTTTEIATKKIKPTSEIISEAMKQGTKISQENRDKIIKEMKISKKIINQPVENIEKPQNHSRYPEDDIEKHIDIAKLEISDSIQTKTKIGRGRAEEIVELMELMKQKEVKTQQTKEKETILSCPIACKVKLNLKEYIDHVIECEKEIEKCKKCGPEFKNNNIHREPGRHSKVTQQFNCMDCMQAHAIRVRIINNHSNTCIKLGTEEYTNQKTPEFTGKELQEACSKNKEIKKLLKENFKKRILQQSNKQTTNPTFKILTILGLITIIYMSTYIIAQAAQMKSDTTVTSETQEGQTKNQPELYQSKIKEPTTPKDTGPHPDPNKIRTENKPKWRTKKAKQKTIKKESNNQFDGPTIPVIVPEESSQNNEQSNRDSIYYDQSVSKLKKSTEKESGNQSDNPTIPVIVLEESSQNKEQNNRDSFYHNQAIINDKLDNPRDMVIKFLNMHREIANSWQSSSATLTTSKKESSNIIERENRTSKKESSNIIERENLIVAKAKESDELDKLLNNDIKSASKKAKEKKDKLEKLLKEIGDSTRETSESTVAKLKSLGIVPDSGIREERAVGQDKEPLIATCKSLGIVPGSVNWCQNIEDNSECHNCDEYIHKGRKPRTGNLEDSGIREERAVGQDKEPLIATFKSLGIVPGSVNWCQNIEDNSECHNCNEYIHKGKKPRTDNLEECNKDDKSYIGNTSPAMNKTSYNQENKRYIQNLEIEAYLNIAVQLTEEMNNFINRNRVIPAEDHQMLEARATHNCKL